MTWYRQRKRLLLQFAVLAGSVLTGITLTHFSGRTARFSDRLIDDAAYREVTDGRTYQQGLAAEVIFGEERLFHDEEENVWYYSLTEQDGHAVDPAVKVRSKKGGVEFAVRGGAITQESIRRNESWALLFYDDAHYETATLKCTTLPIMSIETDGEISDDHEKQSVMRLSLYDNRREAARRLTVSEGLLHTRGRSSSDNPKKSYRISLRQRSPGENVRSRELSFLGMRRDDDWILYGIYDDPERIRNVFSSNLWTVSCGKDNRDRVQTGVEYRYLELIVNGRYAGLYALGYPIQNKAFGIGGDPAAEMLYKIDYYGDDNRFYLDSEGRVSGYEPASASYGQGTDVWQLLRDYYIVLGESGHDDSVLANGIDPDNAVDFWLFINLIQGMDNLDDNHYLALRRENGGIRALYAPWDMDATWGNDYSGGRYIYAAEENFFPHSGYLYQMILNGDQGIRDRIVEKYAGLRGTVWSDEAIGRMLDGYERDIYGSGAYIREMDRWEQDSYNDPKDALDAFRAYVLRRLRAVDDWMRAPAWTEFTQEYPVRFETDLFQYLYPVCQEVAIKAPVFCMEICDPVIWQEAWYQAFYDALSIPEDLRASGVLHTKELFRELGLAEPITEDIDALFWKAEEGKAEAVRKMRVSGSSFSLSVGEVQYFAGENGVYGIYLNGNELYAGTLSDGGAPVIRLIAYFPGEGTSRVLLTAGKGAEN